MLILIKKIKKFIFNKVLLLDESEINDIYKMERFKEKMVINVGGRLATFLLLIFGTIDLFKERFVLSAVVYIIGIIMIFLVNLYNKTDSYKAVAYLILGILSILMIFLFCEGNPEILGYLWTLILPFYFVFFARLKRGFLLSIIYLVTQFFIYSLNLFDVNYTRYFIMRYISIYLVLTLIAVLLEWFRGITYEKLKIKNNEVVETVNKLSAAQEFLLASEIKYKTLVENNIDGIAIIRDNRFLYVNPQLCSLLDFTKEELEKNYLSEFIPEKEIGKFSTHLLKKNILENDPIKFETLIYNRSGNTINIKIQKSNIIYNNNIAYLVIIKDIRERLKLEAERLKVSKLSLFGTLADGITHDFNNLLTISLGYVEALNISLKGDEKTKKYLQKIEDASKRSQSLIAEFKMLSTNELPVKTEEDLHSIVKDSIKKLNNAKLYDIRLTKEDDVSILCDRELISIAIENIINNSMDAIDESGEINIKLQKVFIEKNDIPGGDSGNYILLTIHDDGCGIKKENLNKIFDPYYSTKDHVTKKGMGFGLAITEKIISNHQGFIKVDSKEGLYASFFVYLPYRLNL